MKTIIAIFLMLIPIADQPRKVLLFYNVNGESQWKAQQQLLQAADKEIRERDIEVTSIPFTTENAKNWKKWNIDNADPYTFILIGRDGGEKLRSNEVVKAEKLFGLIDAMPMRKREATSPSKQSE